jgi:hypothetical protein
MILPLHNFNFWQTCFWSMGDGCTSKLLRWAWPHLVFLLLAYFLLICLHSITGIGWHVVVYFFYKNLAFTLTHDWFESLYTVLFTTLPIIVVGIFDKVYDANTFTPKSLNCKHHLNLNFYCEFVVAHLGFIESCIVYSCYINIFDLNYCWVQFYQITNDPHLFIPLHRYTWCRCLKIKNMPPNVQSGYW